MKLSSARIIVHGADSQLGREVLNMLAEQGADIKNIHASEAIKGDQVSFGDDGVMMIVALDTLDLDETDIVIFTGEGREAAGLARKLSGKKTIMIDASGTFAMDPDVPLVVPEVNGDALKSLKKNIVANPNSLAVFLSLALKPLHTNAKVKRAVVSTYQSVSHWGRAAQDELFSQTKAMFMAQAMKAEQLPKQIAFNCYPMLGHEREDGWTDVEFQTVGQVKKIVDTKIKMAVNTVTVPCFAGDAMMVNVECENDISPIQAAIWLAQQSGMGVMDGDDDIPTHADISGEGMSFAARLRDDISVENGISFWLIGDNQRKGSALNIVQIAEAVLKNK